MWKRLSQYLFKSPDEIGLDNYLVLVFCLLSAILGIIGTFINIGLHLSNFTIICTSGVTVIFSLVYLYSRKKGEYIISKYIIIILGIILLNVQWFINYGSTGPILYLFVVVESFIIVFFIKKEKLIFSIIVFANVTLLFYIEYRYPSTIGKYASESARLIDIFTGMLIYLVLSILLLNVAIKFYIHQQEKAQLSDKLKSAFLANMSHEIRTPMNGILGFAELLKEPNLTGDEQQEYISIIEKSGVRMLNIINDIIDISKIESGLMKVDIQESDINKQIDYIYTFFKNEVETKGLQFSYSKALPSNEAIIRTDREKLYAILINLVKNAVKYTDKGSIEFGYNKILDSGQPVVEFFVKDTGVGIPEDRHKAIFERFIQADINDLHAFQGAGLGLSISHAYVELLSGKIRLESEPGKGTVFYFTIPYNSVSKVEFNIEKVVSHGTAENSFNNLKILIAEDDNASEMLIAREVKKYSRELLTVKTGREAVETSRNNPDIDMILMDIKMPGMNGYDATREIRRFNKDVIIIAQTAFALSGDQEKSLEAGCNEYISKPINNSVLRALIEKHFTNRDHSVI
jgi:signal transduction histidine kinase/ActR/RegA family two-component response regulator